MKISELKEFPNLTKTETALLLNNGISPTANLAELFPDVYLDNLNTYTFLRNVMKPLAGIKEGVEFIKAKIAEKKKIFIFGDYDADGVLGTLILLFGLKELGANVDFMIPNRISNGYGINTSMIDSAIESGCQVIVTVDNGISCKKEIDYALSKGLEVLVTDHHIPTEGEIPENVLIIDPKYSNEEFPEISGAYVSFKLIYALIGFTQTNRYVMQDLLILAGISTVTDMMPLLNENRALVKIACEEIDFYKSKSIWSGIILKLISGLGGKNVYVKAPEKQATADLFGFNIGPTINSVSRVSGDATSLINDILSLTERGVYLSSDYYYINKERQTNIRTLVSMIREHSEDAIVELFDKDNFDFPLDGLCGLVSNKLTEKYNKPVLTGIIKNEFYAFSGRSPLGYSLYDGFMRIKEAHPDIYIEGGGHAQAMAVRVLIEDNSLELFRKYFEADVKEHFKPVETSYYELEDCMLDDIANSLKRFKYFGNNFKSLTFKYSGNVVDISIDNKMIQINDILFRWRENPAVKIGDTVEITCTVGTDEQYPYFKILTIQ